MQLNRPIQTRFRYGYASEKLNLATQSKSPAHYTKGTRSCMPSKLGLALPQLVGYTVSGTISLP